MLEFYVIIDFIDYPFLSIINTNRSVKFISTGIDWLSFFMRFIFSQDFQNTVSLCIK